MTDNKDFVMVPREPTPEQVRAGQLGVTTDCVKAIYAAMLQAAPAAEGEAVAWRVRGYAQFKTGKPGVWRYFDGPTRPAVNTPDCCDMEPLYAAQAGSVVKESLTGADVAPPAADRISTALAAPGCERLRDFYQTGPAQRASVETFADGLAGSEAGDWPPGWDGRDKEAFGRALANVNRRPGYYEAYVHHDNCPDMGCEHLHEPPALGVAPARPTQPNGGA